MPKHPHIDIRIHALLPENIGAVHQTSIAVLAGFRVDGRRGVSLRFWAIPKGYARPLAAAELGRGTRRAAGWVLAAAV